MGSNKVAIDALKKSLDELEKKDAAEDGVKTQEELDAEAAAAAAAAAAAGGDAEIEKMAADIGNKIAKAMNLDKLEKLFALVDKATDEGTFAKLFDAKTFKKEKEAMSKEEIIIGFTKALLTDNKQVIKALSEGVAADGGNLFPNEFYAEIIKKLVQQPRMRSLVRVIPMRKDVMDIPSEGAKVTVSWGSENTAITTTTADFGTKQLTAYRMNSILYLSRELAEDATEIGIVDLIVQQFADAVGDEEDKVILQGTGSGQPTGLSTSGGHSVVCSGNLDYDDIIDAFYALPQQYRGSAVWLVNTVNVRELRKIKDSNGRYLWQDAVTLDALPSLNGRPVYEVSWCPEATIYFSDLKRAYYLGDRQQMTVETTTEGGGTWEKHQVGIKVIERIAGITVNPDAVGGITSIP